VGNKWLSVQLRGGSAAAATLWDWTELTLRRSNRAARSLSAEVEGAGPEVAWHSEAGSAGRGSGCRRKSLLEKSKAGPAREETA